jgi:hypothetical protein
MWMVEQRSPVPHELGQNDHEGWRPPTLLAEKVICWIFVFAEICCELYDDEIEPDVLEDHEQAMHHLDDLEDAELRMGSR